MDAKALTNIGDKLEGSLSEQEKKARKRILVSQGDEAEAVEALLLSPKRAPHPQTKRHRSGSSLGEIPSDLKDVLQRVSTKVLERLEQLRNNNDNSMSSSSSSTSSSSSNSALSSFCSQSVIKDVSKEFIMRAKSGEWASVEQWRVNALVEDRARDTINVLLATGAIVRPKESRADGCDMLWVGLPGNSKRELSQLQRERSALARSIDKKHRHLQDLLVQSIAMENLAKRNKERVDSPPAGERIPLPFIMVSTDKDTVIECEMAEDQSDIFFNFNKPFDIHDDGEVLRRMRLAKADDAFIRSILPEHLLSFVPKEAIKLKDEEDD